VNPPAPHILGSSGKVQEMSFEEDFDRHGIGGLSGIFLKNLERLQELPEHVL
jgi:hypothetical protein